MSSLTRTDQRRKKYAQTQSKTKGREICTDLQDIPELLKLSHDLDPDVRSAAVAYLCPCHVQRNKPEVWERLFELTKDPDLKIRKMVFHILADGSPHELENEVITAMKSMYQDPDLKFRRQIRKFLAQYRRTGRINIL